MVRGSLYGGGIMNPTTELITAVRMLHEICTPDAEIARRMHCDQATVKHINQHGTVPHTRLPVMWRHEPGKESMR